MIPSLISFLESELGRDNSFVALLLGLSSTFGPWNLNAASSIFALCVWLAFVWTLVSKRASAAGTDWAPYFYAHAGKISLEFLIGSLAVHVLFGTPFLFDTFGPLKEYFSDGNGQSSGLKFLFGYDTESWWYQAYFTGAVLLWSLCLVRGAYSGTMYHFVFKGEAVIAGRTTSYLTQFKAFASVWIAVTVICFSTAPEGLVNMALHPLGTSVREIMTWKPGS